MNSSRCTTTRPGQQSPGEFSGGQRRERGVRGGVGHRQEQPTLLQYAVSGVVHHHDVVVAAVGARQERAQAALVLADPEIGPEPGHPRVPELPEQAGHLINVAGQLRTVLEPGLRQVAGGGRADEPPGGVSHRPTRRRRGTPQLSRRRSPPPSGTC
jgi:hypothetical protein